MLRYGVGLLFGGTRVPWATLSVYLVGSFALGLLLTYALGRWSTSTTTALSVGVVGGFTTFSTFAWETFTMIQAGNLSRASVYVGLSAIGGLLAALAGYATAVNFSH
jgi:CrcB protein